MTDRQCADAGTAVHRTCGTVTPGDTIRGMTDAWEVTCRPLWKRPVVLRRARGGRGEPGRGAHGVLGQAPGRVAGRRAASRAGGHRLPPRGHRPGERRRGRPALPDAAAPPERAVARHRRPARTPVRERVQEIRRVSVVLRDGRKRLLPLPLSWSSDDRRTSTRSWTRSARCTAATEPRSRAISPSSRTAPPGAARPCRWACARCCSRARAWPRGSCRSSRRTSRRGCRPSRAPPGRPPRSAASA